MNISIIWKSCLMKTIYGDLNPMGKLIRFDSKTIVGSYRLPSDIRFLPQSQFIPRSHTVQRIFNDFKLDFSLLLEYFPEFGFHSNPKLRHLSGGERRIVEIFVILMSDVKFCMLDEPFSHVMQGHIEKIRELIILQKQNKGIIITDHMYKHIVDICDSLYVISQEGRATIRADNPTLCSLLQWYCLVNSSLL